MILAPAPDYRRTFKRGMSGTDVAALQLNLPVTVDGWFGEQTGKAIRELQRRLNLFEDGIAGPATQQALVRERSASAELTWKLPTGMLASLVANESAFMVAAYSPHPSDDGYDIGAFQTSITVARDQTTLASAYDVLAGANRYAEALAKARKAYASPVDSLYRGEWPSTLPEERKGYTWQLAVLAHNWPYAAQNIAKIGRIFTEEGRDDREEAWIVSASAGRLHTPREWVEAYVERATAFVDWTPVPS